MKQTQEQPRTAPSPRTAIVALTRTLRQLRGQAHRLAQTDPTASELLQLRHTIGQLERTRTDMRAALRLQVAPQGVRRGNA